MVSAAALFDVLRGNTEFLEARELFEPVHKKLVLNAYQTPVYSGTHLTEHDGESFIFALK